MSDLEDKIRARAHEIWVSEGYPEGCAEQHWLSAQAMIMEEMAEAVVARKPAKTRAPRAKKAPTLKVVSSQDAA